MARSKEARNRATRKYAKKTYDAIRLSFRKEDGTKEQIANYCIANGIVKADGSANMSEFAKMAVMEKLMRKE